MEVHVPVSVQVVRGSLTDGAERVLVNASNTQLDLGSGVSAAIAQACGAGFQERIHSALRSRRGGPLSPGEVLVTDAGAHPQAGWVAHVAVMDYRAPASGGGEAGPTLDRIRTGCEALWDAIEQLDEPGLSVAMVALGAGVGGLAVRDSTRIGCETLRAHHAIHTRSRIARVVFYGFAQPDFLEITEEVARHFPGAEASLR